MSLGKKEMNDIGVRFCGSGGMGVILASVILGTASILDNKNAVQTQSYGAEQRGTKVKSDVIISSKEKINYPSVEKADILVAFSKDAFDFFYPKTTKPNSKIFINSNLIDFSENNENVFKIPANEIATEINFIKGLNFIMLGGLIKTTALVSVDSIKKAINQVIPKKFREMNIKSFQKGHNYL